MDQRTRLYDQEQRLLEGALAAFARATGLKAEAVAIEPRTDKHRRPDALIDIRGAGKRRRFVAEIKRVDRKVALAAAKHQLERYGREGLLIAPYITAELADECRDKLDLQFIDVAGNAYLRAPGLYVFVKGERPKETTATALGYRGGGTATALRIIFAILCKPELLNAPYREIVRAADVALGAVGWVFFDLRERGLIAGGLRKRNLRLVEPQRILEEWATNYPIRLRPKLNPQRFQAPNPNWWENAHLKPQYAWWGGEVAADKLTNYLKPANYTIYVAPDMRQATVRTLVAENHLRAAPQGNVEVLDAFWKFTTADIERGLVPPLLTYADLLATLDPRNLEVAKLIRERYMENALRPT